MGYAIFIAVLKIGYGAIAVACSLFGLFVMIQSFVTFNQLLRFLNRIKPTSVLLGTSLDSLSHHVIHALIVFSMNHFVSKKSVSTDYIFFFIVLTSILLTNFFAWLLNKQVKAKGINLDSSMYMNFFVFLVNFK
jgi:hypothetical protein